MKIYRRIWVPQPWSWRRVRTYAAWVMVAVLWSLSVWFWPGLRIGGDTDSLALQPGVLIACSSIAAAIVLFAFAVGAITLQVMPQYSWPVIRGVLPVWFVAVLLGVVGGGVVFPLWVAFVPAPALSTWAFVAFGWSIIAIGVLVLSAARRMNPVSLSENARARAVVTLSHGSLSVSDSEDLAEVLGQLVSTAVLPFAEGLKLIGSYAMVLTARSRLGAASDETAVAVRALGERAAGAQSVALAAGIVRAVGVVGLDRVEDGEIAAAVWATLQQIAITALSQGQRPVARVALDTLVDVVAARIDLLTPQEGVPTPPEPWPSLPPPLTTETDGASQRQYFVVKPVVEAVPAPRRPATTLSKRERQAVLSRFAHSLADGEATPPAELIGFLDTALRSPAAQPRAEGQAADALPQYEAGSGYDLFRETVDLLVAMLAAPRPASSGWPAGWQGHDTFDEDVHRLARLADTLYRHGKHPYSDAVETALEQIGVQLRDERAPETTLPAGRTAWREPLWPSEEGGIAASTAHSLAGLAESAFNAGFDRRAMNTGRRLLALATATAAARDATATTAYANAVHTFTQNASLHNRTAATRAGGQRMQAVLIGMIAECAELFTAAADDPRIEELIETITDSLVWNAPDHRKFTTASALLQVRLITAEWPLDPPTGHVRFAFRETPKTPLQLPSSLVQIIEKDIEHWLGCDDPRWPAAGIVALWAHAAAAVRDGNADEAKRVGACLLALLRDYDERHRDMPATEPRPGEDRAPGYQALAPQLRRLMSSAIRWCTRAAPKLTPTIGHAGGPRTVRAAVRALVAQAETENWTYRGLENDDGPDIVTVEMADGSVRVLRSPDARTDEFNWGYGGSGPSILAPALLADVLAEIAHCNDCLGTAPLSAGLIRCVSCRGGGLRHGTRRAERDLLEHIMEALPHSVPWQRTRHDLLRVLAK